jgi:tetratricopeptide (TPR) repeat protein
MLEPGGGGRVPARAGRAVSGGDARGRRQALAVALALALVTLAPFARVAGNGFVDYDDPAYVTENPQVLRGLTPAGVRWAFTTFSSANWHPLTWLSHELDVTLFGLDAGRHHLVSVGLHAATAALLFLALRGMTGAVGASAAAAALFALHPLRVESVAWAAERKDVLAGLFWMLTWLAYLHHARRPSVARLAGVAALFALGLMAKPMLVTLPLALLLLDWWPLGRWRGADAGGRRRPLGAWLPLVAEKLPLLALSAAASALTLVAQRRGGAMNLPGLQHLAVRVDNAVVAYAAYLGKVLWPQRLAIFYPLEVRPAWQAAAAGCALALLCAGAVWAARRRPWLAFGWFWFLGTLVPVIGIVQVGGQALADRYSYLPSVGLSVAVAWAAAGMGARLPRGRALAAGLAVAVCALLAALTWRQIGAWRDTATLFGHALEVTENNWLAHNNLGYALQQQGKYAEAARHFQEAARINPDAADYGALAALAAAAGRPQDAAAYYRRALALRPGSVVDRFNYANLLAAQGRDGEAIALYQDALRLDPRHAESHNNLGILLSRRGDARAAADHFARALQANPAYAAAHFNLGLELARLGRDREAVAHYRQAIALRPDHVKALVNLAGALLRLGERDEAIARYRDALRLQPDSVEARAGLAAAGAGR